MGNVLLEVKSIRTAMDGVEILRDVSFELEAGECLAVIGANGAGKSILAKIIAGNLTPDRGRMIGSFCDISFSLRQHEILGICGNAGSGKYQLMRVISGMEKAEQGEIRMKNRRLEVNSVKDAFHEGIVYIPEIPDGLDDLFLHMSIAENVSVADLPREPGYLPYASGNARDQAEQMCRNLCISGYRGLETPVEKLSGGNQQKIRLGRRLFTESRVLLLEEPTRGIDIVSKVDFYNHICDFVVGRAGVILLSSDMNELAGLCDRILVMEGGRFRAEINRQEIEKLGSYV